MKRQQLHLKTYETTATVDLKGKCMEVKLTLEKRKILKLMIIHQLKKLKDANELKVIERIK